MAQASSTSLIPSKKAIHSGRVMMSQCMNKNSRPGQAPLESLAPSPRWQVMQASFEACRSLLNGAPHAWGSLASDEGSLDVYLRVHQEVRGL